MLSLHTDETGLSDAEGVLLENGGDPKLYPWNLWSTANKNIVKENGSEFVIAVIDTGIKQDHVVFAPESGKILPESKSFVDKTIEDKDGHGTLCAGIAAGGIIQKVFWGGVASEAKLLVCKVSNNRTFWRGKVIEALKYIEEVHKKRTVHVVSMSFGYKSHSPELERCINRLTMQGVVCVAASGNDGNNPTTPVRHPAVFDGVISVGAHDYKWKLAGLCADPSIKGTKIDCTTLGVDVCGPSCDKRKPFGKFSGTSIAAAVAAGLIVCILQRELGPEKTGDKLERVKSSLKKITDEQNPILPLSPAYTFVKEPGS